MVMTTVEKIAVVEEELVDTMTQISNTSVRRILHDHLDMNQESPMWIPKLLSAVQREYRVASTRSIL